MSEAKLLNLHVYESNFWAEGVLDKVFKCYNESVLKWAFSHCRHFDLSLNKKAQLLLITWLHLVWVTAVTEWQWVSTQHFQTKNTKVLNRIKPSYFFYYFFNWKVCFLLWQDKKCLVTKNYLKKKKSYNSCACLMPLVAFYFNVYCVGKVCNGATCCSYVFSSTSERMRCNAIFFLQKSKKKCFVLLKGFCLLQFCNNNNEWYFDSFWNNLVFTFRFEKKHFCFFSF